MEACTEVCSLDKYGIFLETLTMLASLTMAAAAISAFYSWKTQRNAKIADEAFNALYEMRRLYDTISGFEPFFNHGTVNELVAENIKTTIELKKEQLETLNLCIHKLHALTRDQKIVGSLSVITEALYTVYNLCTQIKVLHSVLTHSRGKTAEEAQFHLTKLSEQLLKFFEPELKNQFLSAYEKSFGILTEHMNKRH